jgi:hypothetical protein
MDNSGIRTQVKWGADLKENDQAHAAAWRNLRFRNRLFWAALAAVVVLVFITLFPKFARYEATVVWSWVALLVLANWYYSAFRCPRCHKQFFKPSFLNYNTFAKKCPHCGLTKWS